MSILASSAFLAFAAGMRALQTVILRKSNMDDEDSGRSLSHWKLLSNMTAVKDHGTDSTVANTTFQKLFTAQIEQYHRARLLATEAAHSGDWLHYSGGEHNRPLCLEFTNICCGLPNH